MNSELLSKVESGYYKNDTQSFNVGDMVKVHNVIRDGEKSRVQIFAGLVIAKKGSGTRATFTVRKISDGIGVEKIFPIHSPNVEKIEVTRRGKVRQAKLFYLRDRVGKSALKVKQGSEPKKAESKKVDPKKAEPKQVKSAEEKKATKKAEAKTTDKAKSTKESAEKSADSKVAPKSEKKA